MGRPKGSLNQIRTFQCATCEEIFETRSNRKLRCDLCASKQDWHKNKVKPEYRMKKLWAAARFRATAKKLLFDITPEYILSLFQEQMGQCALTGISFELKETTVIKGVPNRLAPSIDRIKPSEGYVMGNVRLVCFHANMALGYWGQDAFENLIKAYQEHNGVSYAN